MGYEGNRGEEDGLEKAVSHWGGFSNFGEFRAPIKRINCNPIVKDEVFKRMAESDGEGLDNDEKQMGVSDEECFTYF